MAKSTQQEINDQIIKGKDIVEELEASFLEYAMSVITSRAIPDTRDGLKPVHRRILYAMFDLGMLPNKPYKKSARVTGEVIGKYHPHGDSSVYEAMVRMAQEFSMRYPLVDGQGNFGSIDGDSAAAMRYTEARLTKFGLELLDDLDKDTVDFIPNYDGEENEPTVLPAKLPNLLANGSSGIAVAMTSKIPPHNVSELLDAAIMLVKNADTTLDDVIKIVKGPDFPTGGTIMGNEGIIEAYKTGIGSLRIHAKANIINKKDKKQIIVYEIPFEVNKANLVEKIAYLSNTKEFEGIKELRDETNYEGIRIVIEIKDSAQPEVVLNKLYKKSELEKSFSMRLNSIYDGVPRLFNIKQMMDVYVAHQREVLIRKSKFNLNQASDKLHLSKGFVLALQNIEQIINIIKKSDTTAIAQQALISKYELSVKQAKAILELRLARISSLEVNSLKEEIKELEAKIKFLESLISTTDVQNKELVTIFEGLKSKFGDKRRTEILEGRYDGIDNESLIPKKEIVIMLSKTGYIKRVAVEEFRVQNHGGQGAKGMKVAVNDELQQLVKTKTHTDVLVFTNKGKVYKMRAHNIIEARKDAKGVPIQNIIDIKKSDGEVAKRIIAIDEYKADEFLFFVTNKGLIKKTSLKEFERVNRNGKIAFGLRDEHDGIFSVKKITNDEKIIIGSSSGRSTYFSAASLRASGRTSTGVRGIKLEPSSNVISLATSTEGDHVLSISVKGIGKLTELSKYGESKNRGGKGSISLKTAKAGKMIAQKVVSTEDDVIIATNKGTTLRINVSKLKPKGRNTMGVRIMKLKENEKVTTMDVIEKGDIDDVIN